VQNLPVTHDAFFRALMDEPSVAAALLREHLPAEVAALLAPEAPELLDAHFVAAHLRHSQADRLYEFLNSWIALSIAELLWRR